MQVLPALPHTLQFEELATCLRQTIKNQVFSFTRDQMLSRIEDADSLYNLALLKLHEAWKNFVYDPSFDEAHNERRFLAMLFKYIRNIMIDRQYFANLKSRKPSGALLSLDESNDDDEGSATYGTMNAPESKTPSAFDELCGVELYQKIMSSLRGEDRAVFELLAKGFTVEAIAGKLGMQITRVGYIIYSKIRKRASLYVNAST